MNENIIREFNEINRKSEELRELQKKLLADALRDAGFNVRRGGKGIAHYTSGGNLKKPYDLRDWKFLNVERADGVKYFISFQAPDVDPSSHNPHTLRNRIGICHYTGNYNTEYVYNNMKVLNAELPLKDEDIDEIIKYMEAC